MTELQRQHLRNEIDSDTHSRMHTKYMQELLDEDKAYPVGKYFKYASIALVTAITLSFGTGYLIKEYNVWAMKMQGKALLAEATQSRQIQIEQAKGEKESAKHLAEAIAIVGQASKTYPEYRTQMYIQAFGEALKGGKIEQIIYIPTEAGIPILEAGKQGIAR